MFVQKIENDISNTKWTSADIVNLARIRKPAQPEFLEFNWPSVIVWHKLAHLSKLHQILNQLSSDNFPYVFNIWMWWRWAYSPLINNIECPTYNSQEFNSLWIYFESFTHTYIMWLSLPHSLMFMKSYYHPNWAFQDTLAQFKPIHCFNIITQLNFSPKPAVVAKIIHSMWFNAEWAVKSDARSLISKSSDINPKLPSETTCLFFCFYFAHQGEHLWMMVAANIIIYMYICPSSRSEPTHCLYIRN